MKRIIQVLLLLTVCTGLRAQESRLGCNDKAIRLQAEQIKAGLKAQGFKVVRDAMITMDSRQPAPIGIQFVKGKLYQLIYIGDRRASRIDFELLDENDKRIEHMQLKKPSENNFLIYAFTPAVSDIFLVILSQRWKTNSMCGSFTIMEKDADGTNTTAPGKE